MLPYKFGFDNWDVTEEAHSKETTESEVNDELDFNTSDDLMHISLTENNESMDSVVETTDVSEQMKKVFFCV